MAGSMPVFEGDVLLGHVDVFLPPPSSAGGGREHAVLFPSNEIRISRRSPASGRCPPVAVLQVISAYSMRCKLRENTTSPLLRSLHSTCWNQRTTAVVDAGAEELHLVAMQSQVDQEGVPAACFWCWSARVGLYAACLAMLDKRCIAIVFDLDETLVFSNDEDTFRAHMKNIESRLKDSKLHKKDRGTLQDQLCQVSTDDRFLKDFVRKCAITVDREIVRSQLEKSTLCKPGGPQQSLSWPVIRVPRRNAVLTRVVPMPGWDDLKCDLITTSGCRRYKVYVCTMAGTHYALEVWRLLDPDGSLISPKEISQRLICVRQDSKKSLQRVFKKSLCHPNMTMVIDDRMDVWHEKDQRRVHNLSAYNPSVAPEDKVVHGRGVLQILRNTISKVHQGFFSEFVDGMLLKAVDELMYENDVLDLPCPPDVADYLQPRNNKILKHNDAPISAKNTSRDDIQRGSRN